MKYKIKILSLWDDLRTSYWMLPTVLSLSALGLSQITLKVDRSIDSTKLTAFSLLYTGSVDGARAILSTIAGSMIGIAGVVFSITIVTLALASRQFGPRLLRNFMRDRVSQVVLGTFVSTFLFCLLILRQLHGQDENKYAKFIPQISMLFAVILAAASIAVLIIFIHHIAKSIQAPLVISNLRRQLRKGISDSYPEQQDAAKSSRLDRSAFQRAQVGRTAHFLRSPVTGYIRRIDFEQLVEIAQEFDLIIRVLKRPGDFIMDCEPVFEVWLQGNLTRAITDNILSNVGIGEERTQEQDIRFTIDQLVGICLMALSPSVNDPFTARQCIDALTDGIAYFLRRYVPFELRFDPADELRLIFSPIDFTALISTAFDEIRLNSKGQIGVANHLLRSLYKIAEHGNSRSELESTLHAAKLVADQIEAEATNPYDLDTVSGLMIEFEKLDSSTRKGLGGDTDQVKG